MVAWLFRGFFSGNDRLIRIDCMPFGGSLNQAGAGCLLAFSNLHGNGDGAAQCHPAAPARHGVPLPQ